MQYRFVLIQSCLQDNFYSIITLEKIPGAIGKFFGAKMEIEKFHGSGTVWHNMKTGLRAGCSGNALHDFFIGSTLMERFLFDIWNTHRTHPTVTPVA